MGAFFASGIGQFIKGALLAAFAAVLPLINANNFSLKLLGAAAIGGLLEYIHNYLTKP